MNNVVIRFPQTHSSTSTIGAIVYVRRLDPDDLTVVLSANEVALVENSDDVSSDLDLTNFVSGTYDLIFKDTVNFTELDITQYVHSSILEIPGDYPNLDLLTIILGEDSTDNDTFQHNLGTSNYIVEAISMDASTLGEKLGGTVIIAIANNTVSVKNASTEGYTRYKLQIFNRSN